MTAESWEDKIAGDSFESEGSPEAAQSQETGGASQGAAGADKLAAELRELNDKHLRLYAEFENFRRRTSKEGFELISAANNKLIGKLTEVLDNFNLAFDPKHKTEKLEDMEKGFRLIYGKFRNILEEEGLEDLDPKNGEFDPNLHDAVMQQPSETVPEDHVIQVLQKGYKVKGKILKHAKVIVSTGKPS